jgi:hypothetical protein
VYTVAKDFWFSLLIGMAAGRWPLAIDNENIRHWKQAPSVIVINNEIFWIFWARVAAHFPLAIPYDRNCRETCDEEISPILRIFRKDIIDTLAVGSRHQQWVRISREFIIYTVAADGVAWASWQDTDNATMLYCSLADHRYSTYNVCIDTTSLLYGLWR